MSLFQSTFLPNLKDQSDETEVRKMGQDLLKKINQLSDSTDTSVSTLTADIAAIPNLLDDSRITTGTADRTETVLSLEIGQTADINWACGITGGVVRTVFFALPNVVGVSDTYEVNIIAVASATNALNSAAGAATAFLTSAGQVAGGSSAGYVTPSGQSINFVGKVKRIS